jgi:hypothetical protein
MAPWLSKDQDRQQLFVPIFISNSNLSISQYCKLLGRRDFVSFDEKKKPISANLLTPEHKLFGQVGLITGLSQSSV